MAGRYSPPPHPERTASFNPLAHLLKHLADSPPTTPIIFTPTDLEFNPATHDPEDILRELRSDGENPFPIDRNQLKKVVNKKLSAKVDSIAFLSSGTFHKAFLVTLKDGREVVARIARRYMPRLKTESEVATINYIRQHTNVPVPIIYHFDSNPYNRLGGEYILMSKAPGIPLSRLFYQASPEAIRRCFTSLATILITLFSHRFPRIGSLYQHPTHPSPLSTSLSYHYRVGPIVSWPFFGGGRGEFADVPRGPWATEQEYLIACTEREFQAVRREGEGVIHHHRPHLPPDDEPSSEEEDDGHIGTPNMTMSTPVSTLSRSGSGINISMRRPGVSRRHHSHRGAGLSSIVGSTFNSPGATRPASPDSDSSSSSSEEEFYRDHRAHLRSSLLVAHQQRRLESCMNDMQSFLDYMTKDLGVDGDDEEFREFSLDLHDLSLTNVFVDPEDLGKITCIIDWESTTIRPLWQCAHLPSFLASDPTSPHAILFREVVSELGLPQRVVPEPSLTSPSPSPSPETAAVVKGGSATMQDSSINLNGDTLPDGVLSVCCNGADAPSPPASLSSSSFSSPSTAPTSAPPSPVKVQLTPRAQGDGTTTATTVKSKKKYVIPPTADVHPPAWAPDTPPSESLQQEAQKWLKGESEREEWRRAHKVVEWDGWEEGLVGMILGEGEGDGASVLGLNKEAVKGLLKPTSAISPAAVSNSWAINGSARGGHAPHGQAHARRW